MLKSSTIPTAREAATAAATMLVWIFAIRPPAHDAETSSTQAILVWGFLALHNCWRISLNSCSARKREKVSVSMSSWPESQLRAEENLTLEANRQRRRQDKGAVSGAAGGEARHAVRLSACSAEQVAPAWVTAGPLLASPLSDELGSIYLPPPCGQRARSIGTTYA